MKIIKRGKYIYFPGANGESPIKQVLRNLQFDRSKKIWFTENSLIVFKDLWIKFKELFELQDAETKQWVDESRLIIVRLDELQKGISNAKAREIILPNCIDYVLQPFQHQKEAIAYSLNLNKSGLYADLGMGKTYISITIAKIRHALPELGGINKVLVICPRSLMYQWGMEINRFAPDALVFPIEGTPSKKIEICESIPPDKFSFALVTYESVWSVLHYLKELSFDMFILDEATKMKNPKAKRTLATADICKEIPYGLSLTGMPYVGNPLDLFAQFLAIDPTVYGTNQWVFSNRYIDYVTMPFGKIIRGFKHMDELKERLYLSAFSRTKDQCLDLPEKVYQTRKLPIYESQYNWYVNLLDQIEEQCTIQDEPSDKEKPLVTVDYVVAMLEKFQQITSGYITTDGGEFIWLDSPKYEEMLNILNSSTDSFIIWARHSFVLQKIQTYLQSHNIDAVILDRRCSDARRKTIKEQFKKGQQKVLILQLQSECRGNDFTCEVGPVSSIFFENTASVEERAQAEDRQHRIGMRGTAVYIDLICEDTYDEGLSMLLKNKRNISEYIRRKELSILLGKGGSIGLKKTRSKKRPKTPEEVAKESEHKTEAESNVEQLNLYNIGFNV